MAGNLRRRLLVISLLVAYLEDRQVFKLQPDFFYRFKRDATKFSDVLSNADSLIKLLSYLETERFNGNVFTLKHDEKQQLLRTTHLKKFAELIEGTTERGGQLALWRLYSFHDLPVELISHIYQLFVEDKSTCVYTPPFLARLMLEEALTLERMNRLEERDEIVFDPACGSGVFLVESFKRLVVHWRKNHKWERPPVEVLRKLMKRVRGTDIDGSAVELAAFSLCLAMCEELPRETILGTRRLFPALRDETLITGCFFQQVREQKLPRRIGVVVGNPPFGSASTKGTTAQAYEEYQEKHGKQSLPDKQSAYLFLHHSMEALTKDGLLCLLQKDNFLYNRRSSAFRHAVFQRWDVREVLDFTPIRGLFEVKDPKVVVVLAEANPPKLDRSILHAIFRRTSHTQAELSFELDYYDMQWVSNHAALTKDFVWRCNLFGGGRTVSLVERLKKLPKLKAYVEQQGWNYGEGYMVGSPETFSARDLKNTEAFALKLKNPRDTVSGYVRSRLSASTRRNLMAWQSPDSVATRLQAEIVKDLNAIVQGPSIWDVSTFAGVNLRPEVRHLVVESCREETSACVNRLLMEDAYPLELSRIQIVEHLWNQPVIPAKAIGENGVVDERLISKQEGKYFQRPRPRARYEPPLILLAQTDDLPIAYWKKEKGAVTYGQRLLGISGASGKIGAHEVLFRRLRASKSFFRSWLALTSADAGIDQATTLQKTDVDNFPYPETEAGLDLSLNDEIILKDAFQYYRDFQRLGDAADMMREAKPDDHREFAQVFTRQINVVHKTLRALPAKSWAGVCCQPFVFGNAQPDWQYADDLTEKLSALLRHKKSPSLTTIRILRLFDGSFLFLIKPNRLRYWLRSIALRDADETLADLRGMGF